MEKSNIKIGFLSTRFMKTKFIGDFSYEDRQIYNYLKKYIGKENIFILNPLNIGLYFSNNEINIIYDDPENKIPKNVFEIINGLIIRKTRGFSEEIKDILNAIHSKNPKLLMFDPIDVFQDPLSKFSSFLKRQKANLPQPKTIFLYNINVKNINIPEEFNYPLIVKPIKGHLGKCVKKCRNKTELESFIGGKLDNCEEEVLGHGIIIQEVIDIDKEFRVIVINGKSVGCRLKISDDEIKNAYRGAEYKQFEDREAEILAEKAAKAQNVFFAGVDITKDKNGKYYVLECKRSPNFLAFDQGIEDNIENVAHVFIKEVIKTIQENDKNLKSNISFDNYTGSDYDIFLSYSTEDKEIAEELYYSLLDKGLRIWFDSKQDLYKGKDLEKKIGEAIKKSKIRVVLISNDTLAKEKEQRKTLIKNSTPSQIDEIDFIIKNPKLLESSIFVRLNTNIEDIIKTYPLLSTTPLNLELNKKNVDLIAYRISQQFKENLKHYE